MADSNYLLEFIKDLNPAASENGRKLEKLIYEDPQSACINGRVALEAIIDDVIKKEKINDVNFTKLFEKVLYLDRYGFLTKDTKQYMDTVRGLGNKAAHKANFDDIENAIKVFKAIYKVSKWYVEVYSLETIEIPKYRNPQPPSQSNDNKVSDEMINQILAAIQGNVAETTSKPAINTSIDNGNSEGNENKVELKSGAVKQLTKKVEQKESETMTDKLTDQHSYLLRELKKLQESSQEAVESPEAFSNFKKYMHVKRKIQTDLEGILENEQNKIGPSLILLSGSVGDGKSHILSYLKESRPDLINEYRLYNDATESFDPKKSAIETLSEELDGFSDENIDISQDRIIIAINLGILNNFLEGEEQRNKFSKLKEFINNSNVFETKVTAKYSEEDFHIISFSDYQMFELTEQGPQSMFFAEIFSKIFEKNEMNPFYLAYKKDEDRGMNRIIHENYRFLMNEKVQEHIIQLLINIIIQHKLVISARSLFNFIADIVIPDGYAETDDIEWSPLEKLNYITPTLLFARKERSYILKAVNDLDPIDFRSPSIDQILIDLNTLDDWEHTVKELLDDEVSLEWMRKLIHLRRELKELGDKFTYSSEEDFFKSLIRTTYLTSKELNKKVTPESYKDYTTYLYNFSKKNTNSIQIFYNSVKEAIYRWKGSPKKSYIYLSNNGKFKVAQYLDLRPDISHLDLRNESVLFNFKTTLTVAYHGGNAYEKVELDVDYHLYRLILAVLDGYCPNKKDEEDAIQFVEFIEKVMRFGKSQKELIVHIPNEKKMYKLEKNEFGGFIFEKE
ncbi:DNA phosphorothioation-dependent restriction protein DptF [Salipaludibacillus daqingensis]|uniref:DNA phosphorothioation-dependent restriction protein DptF n=1 Tax=Salipaludibacillus daqingensis TaxID=3041001 RepID=UPI002474AD5B|nr:DNA phosphorothioation-dependent restriction protein DptF [Salipaludibacillus daqingensis]